MLARVAIAGAGAFPALMVARYTPATLRRSSSDNRPSGGFVSSKISARGGSLSALEVTADLPQVLQVNPRGGSLAQPAQRRAAVNHASASLTDLTPCGSSSTVPSDRDGKASSTGGQSRAAARIISSATLTVLRRPLSKFASTDLGICIPRPAVRSASCWALRPSSRRRRFTCSAIVSERHSDQSACVTSALYAATAVWRILARLPS